MCNALQIELTHWDQIAYKTSILAIIQRLLKFVGSTQTKCVPEKVEK